MRPKKLNLVCHVFPRTGSTSLYRYLMELSPPATEEGNCWHIHYMVNKRHRWHGKRQFEDIETLDKSEWKVITIVRDPIDSLLSAFWRWRVQDCLKKEEDGINLDRTTRYYMDVMGHRSAIWHLAQEVEAFWGFDIYGTEFNPPYTISQDGRLLILRTKDLDEFAIDALEEFLGYPMTDPGFPHMGASPQPIKLALSQDYVHSMYQHFHVEKFFTEDEVNAMCEKHGVPGFKRDEYRAPYAPKMMTPDDEHLVELAQQGITIRPVKPGEDLSDENVVIAGKLFFEGGQFKEEWEPSE